MVGLKMSHTPRFKWQPAVNPCFPIKVSYVAMTSFLLPKACSENFAGDDDPCMAILTFRSHNSFSASFCQQLRYQHPEPTYTMFKSFLGKKKKASSAEPVKSTIARTMSTSTACTASSTSSRSLMNSSSSGKRVSFVETEISAIYLVETMDAEEASELFYQDEDYIRFHMEEQQRLGSNQKSLPLRLRSTERAKGIRKKPQHRRTKPSGRVSRPSGGRASIRSSRTGRLSPKRR